MTFGTSFGGRNPGELGVAELKRWSQCRAAKRDGRKPELVKRERYVHVKIVHVMAIIARKCSGFRFCCAKTTGMVVALQHL